MGEKHGTVIRVKSLPEKLVALSPRDAIEVKDGLVEGLEMLEVLSHIIFIFH